MTEPPPKRARAVSEPQPAAGGLSAILQEAIYWSRITYGNHPSCLLPPPAGLEALGSATSVPTAPPSVLRLFDRWVKTNPVYATAPLETQSAGPDEAERLDLVKLFLENLPERMRNTPLVPELSTASYDSYMLRLGRRYGEGPDGEVPYCCNGAACAALKIKRAFGTPLQRYYTPTEDAKLQRDPSLLAAFGPGPCLICLRHDVECLVTCNAGRAVDPQQVYGQPYAVMLRVYNAEGVPGGYRSGVFSCTPVTAPELSPVPLVASRIEAVGWHYDNAARVWFVDQTPLVWNPGSRDF